MLKEAQNMQKRFKQQKLFMAEQKRADMRMALYHMAVWNVPDAKEIIEDILEEKDQGSVSRQGGGGHQPISVAEKIRKKAAMMRKAERMGYKGREGVVSDLQSNADSNMERDYSSPAKLRGSNIEGHH